MEQICLIPYYYLHYSEDNDNTNYMTRNPIYGDDSEQQKNNNNCVVNHDSRLNIYNKLLDIRKLLTHIIQN